MTARRSIATNLPLLIILCLTAQFQASSAIRLYPVDDTARDPTFRSYIGKLRSAVDRRNTAALRKLVDNDVVVGPNEADKGWTSFMARWRPDDRERSPLWTALSDLLTLGFIQEHPRLFLSPYLIWRFPREVNMATHLVVVRDKVPLREGPSPRAAAIAYLSFDVVQQLSKTPETGELAQWVHVRTVEGNMGYLNVRDVMSPLMPRAQFGLRQGRWLLIALESPGR